MDNFRGFNARNFLYPKSISTRLRKTNPLSLPAMKGIEAKKHSPADPLSLIFFFSISQNLTLISQMKGNNHHFFSISFTSVVGPHDRSTATPPVHRAGERVGLCAAATTPAGQVCESAVPPPHRAGERTGPDHARQVSTPGSRIATSGKQRKRWEGEEREKRKGESCHDMWVSWT